MQISKERRGEIAFRALAAIFGAFQSGISLDEDEIGAAAAEAAKDLGISEEEARAFLKELAIEATRQAYDSDGAEDGSPDDEDDDDDLAERVGGAIAELKGVADRVFSALFFGAAERLGLKVPEARSGAVGAEEGPRGEVGEETYGDMDDDPEGLCNGLNCPVCYPVPEDTDGNEPSNPPEANEGTNESGTEADSSDNVTDSDGPHTSVGTSNPADSGEPATSGYFRTEEQPGEKGTG